MSEMWAHQREALERAIDLDEFGLFFEAGTGKTRTTIEILRRKYAAEGRVLRTLILGPQVVVENWRREILKFSKITRDQVHTLTGTGMNRLRTFNDNRAKAFIFICNYESLLMKQLYDEFERYNFEVIVLDESHRLKNPGAKRTKAATRLCDQSRYRYILTGTPILNSLLDVYSQFRCLDKGASFGQNYFVFRNQYFYDKNSGMPAHSHFPNWTMKPHMDSVVGEMMQKKTMYVKKSECLDLPPMIRKTVYVELSSEQAKHYESMRKNFITFIESSACTAQLAVTKALRLQQIVSGFLQLAPDNGEPARTLSLKENPRADALWELLEDLTPNHKVIVWACFRENYEQIRQVCEGLKLRFVELHGEIPSGKRQEAIDSFNTDPATRVLIGNQGAGGIGVNLIAASYGIYFSRNFSLEHDVQSEARNYRGGSEIHEKVTRIDIVAKDTIDEKVLESLTAKQALSDKVLYEIAREL